MPCVNFSVGLSGFYFLVAKTADLTVLGNDLILWGILESLV